MSEESNYTDVRFYCPNCGRKIETIKKLGEAAAVCCPRCRAVIFSKQAGKREIKMKIKKAI